MRFAISIATPEVPGEAPLALLSGTFEQRLEKAAAYGYQGVELVVSDPTKLNPAQIKSQLARYGLQPAAVATGFIAGSRGVNLVSKDEDVRRQAAKILKELVIFAGQIGTKIVTIGGFRGKASMVGSQEEARKQLCEALSGVDALAKSLGVTVALEPIQSPETDFLNTGAQVCELIREGGFETVGLLLDLYHMIPSEEALWDAFRIYRDKLVHVHLADTQRKALGRGGLDYAQVEAVLASIGYQGWQSVELPRAEDPDGNGFLPEVLRSFV